MRNGSKIFLKFFSKTERFPIFFDSLFNEGIQQNLVNFIPSLNATPTGRAAIPPAGNRSYEHRNAGGTRVRQDPMGLLWDFRLAIFTERGGSASVCGESA